MNELDLPRLLFLNKPVIRFLLVGISNTIVSYLVFLFGYHILFVGDTLLSQPLSYSIGIAWSYYWNRKWTFQSSAVAGREFFRFLIVQIALLLLSTGLIYYVVKWWHINASISWIFVMIFITALNYLLTKRFVFKIVPRQMDLGKNIFCHNDLIRTKLMAVTIFHRIRLISRSIGQTNSRSVITGKEYVLVLLAITCIFLFLFGPALQAEFYVVEDHTLFRRGSSAISDWVLHIVSDEQNFGRFRPVYWLYVATGDLLFGTHPHLWHAGQILCGVLTCYLFYVALRRIGADIASSFIFLLLVVLSGTQNWIWLNLVPNEPIGMLLTALAVCAITIASQRSRVGRWDVLAFIAMAFAGLAKESFVILIPALLLLYWTCQKCFSRLTWRESLCKLRVPLTIGVLIFVIEIALVIVVLLSHPAGYSAKVSGMSLASFNPRRWLNIVSTLTMDMQIVLAVGVFLWGCLWFDKKVRRDYLLASTLIFFAWLLPQVVLYSNGLNERYLFPAIVSVAASTALSMSILLRHQRLWPLWIIGLLLLLPILANGVKSTSTTVGDFTAETVAANRLIQFLAQNIPADQTILMAGDSGTAYGYESTYSLPMYLKMAGSNSPFYLWPIVSKGERSAMHIVASKNNTEFRYPDSLQPSDVGAIIIVDKWIPAFDSKPLVRWLGDTAWREINFTEPYDSFSFREFRFLKAGEDNHKILLSMHSSGVPSARPLIVVDHSLTGVVNASPLLDSPWGLERDYAGPGSIVWIGQGDEESLGGVLSSTGGHSVNIDLELVPGPSRSDNKRTVEFILDNRAGQQIQREVFEGGQWKFKVQLQPGANHFRLRVLDEATITIQPNGDTRRLLALLRRMTVSSPDKD